MNDLLSRVMQKKAYYVSTISVQMVKKICPLADKVFENEIRKKANTDALAR